jgi:hypothetical protein
VVSGKAGAGFYGGVIVGDPPAAGTVMPHSHEPLWLHEAMDGLHRLAN